MNPLPPEYEEQFKLIKSRYIDNLNDKYENLRKLKDMVSIENPNSKTLLDFLKEVHFNVHKLAGSSALMGFAEISSLAKTLELLLQEILERGKFSYEGNFITHYEKLINEIEAAISNR